MCVFSGLLTQGWRAESRMRAVYRGRLAVADQETVTAGYLADLQLLQARCPLSWRYSCCCCCCCCCCGGSDPQLPQALAGAVSDLEDSFVSVPRLRGLAERVFTLESEMAAVELPEHSPTAGPDDEGLVITNLTIRPPTGRSGEAALTLSSFPVYMHSSLCTFMHHYLACLCIVMHPLLQLAVT